MPTNIADGWKTACESHNQKGQTIPSDPKTQDPYRIQLR